MNKIIVIPIILLLLGVGCSPDQGKVIQEQQKKIDELSQKIENMAIPTSTTIVPTTTIPEVKEEAKEEEPRPVKKVVAPPAVKKVEPIIQKVTQTPNTKEENASLDRIADYFERQEAEKKEKERVQSCTDLAKLYALQETQKINGNTLSYYRTAPSSCQKYEVDLGVIYEKYMTNTTNISASYQSALAHWNEQVKGFTQCIYDYKYYQQLQLCIGK